MKPTSPNVLLFVVATLALVPATLMAEDKPLPPHYAESVMIGYIAPDGSREISLRLARFPETGTSHVWASLATPDGAWSVADESFSTGNSATPTAGVAVSFEGHEGDQSIIFSSSHRHGDKMQGRVSGTLLLRNTRFPKEGPGTIPMRVDLKFQANSAGFKSRGRWELTGKVSGSIQIVDRHYRISGPGKWHEQTGPRARFAPAFTYLNLQNEHTSLLAIGFKDRVVGYLLRQGRTQVIKQFDIDKQGPDERHFTLTLDSGEVITGSARAVQRWSVPIEGVARPGSAVLADTTLGKMTGSLNDWNPSP